ncbi:helix-turn-helix domain-containing protein [Pseudoflavonifractor hominis]|uniref:Helix-turn-helix domain-containing protein n=1 Tax=Pseudoflavonifractor hominis TaxID=2763059 RepID=A0ABR7HT49_9FIRM|nr:helix-turn-helix domain-containing protein [Pseudoflavonifractor hominis]MBC5730690.1 helix-turn-helix domain-containing protein [Pseudoflavonifractor hominis]
MDCEKIGALIRAARRERGMTQRELGEALHISDRTVSKWECAQGCPDVSLLPALSARLGVDLERMLSGDLEPSREKGDSMKRIRFFVCPHCGNVVTATGEASVSCCGRRLEALTPQRAEGVHRLQAEAVEDEWFLTAEHPMEKGHFLSFVAFVTGERCLLIRTYPEWEMQVRIPRRGHGKLLHYCTEHGLFYQLL